MAFSRPQRENDGYLKAFAAFIAALGALAPFSPMRGRTVRAGRKGPLGPRRCSSENSRGRRAGGRPVRGAARLRLVPAHVAYVGGADLWRGLGATLVALVLSGDFRAPGRPDVCEPLVARSDLRGATRARLSRRDESVRYRPRRRTSPRSSRATTCRRSATTSRTRRWATAPDQRHREPDGRLPVPARQSRSQGREHRGQPDRDDVGKSVACALGRRRGLGRRWAAKRPRPRALGHQCRHRRIR